ncbi:MAG: hypothetical protein COA78_31460 [Blastopirellula sp.]|nr:MAG: hypothetical protein COA78_31460 [Blastopirellula sp.]
MNEWAFFNYFGAFVMVVPTIIILAGMTNTNGWIQTLKDCVIFAIYGILTYAGYVLMVHKVILEVL